MADAIVPVVVSAACRRLRGGKNVGDLHQFIGVGA
jgi:hypothetical protein